MYDSAVVTIVGAGGLALLGGGIVWLAVRPGLDRVTWLPLRGRWLRVLLKTLGVLLLLPALLLIVCTGLIGFILIVFLPIFGGFLVYQFHATRRLIRKGNIERLRRLSTRFHFPVLMDFGGPPLLRHAVKCRQWGAAWLLQDASLGYFVFDTHLSKIMNEALNQLRAEHLVETEWLAAHLDDPRVRVVDMRGEVRSQTDDTGYQTAQYLGRADQYAAAHIPGAIYLDWTSDLIDEDDPVPAQAATAEKLARVLGARGIGDGHLVIAYDDHGASQFATRLWWLLRLYGHTECRVLNGGWSKWQAEGRPTTAGVPHYPTATFTPRPQPEWRKSAEEVLSRLNAPEVALIDARDEGQFTGRVRRGIRGGRIPGAVSFPRERLILPDRTFAAPEIIRQAVTQAGITPEREVVAYCNGGVAATSVLFALSMLGYPRLSNYDGSWNEWNRREELPVEKD